MNMTNSDFSNKYDSNALAIIYGLYTQIRIFMPQYGGYAELEDTPLYTLKAYGRSGGLVYGYEFHSNMFGQLMSIRCFGSNMQKDLDGMRMSNQIFNLPISDIDTSDYPNSVMVKLSL